jgi:hypothetical protein
VVGCCSSGEDVRTAEERRENEKEGNAEGVRKGVSKVI